MYKRPYLVFGVAAAASIALVGCRGGSDVATDTTAGGATDTAAATTAAGGDSTATTAAGGDATATTAAGGDSTATTAAGGGDAMAEVECPATTNGLTENSILLGGSYPLSGNVAAYSSISKGANSWFQHLNDTDGGFQMKDGSTLKIEFKILDDQYTPAKAVENVKQLVESDKVFMMFNTLGTPNNSAIREYMNQQEVPQALVATGASKWGKEIDQFPWTIGYQPDYESEGIAYAKYILEQNPDAKIGILYQNDDFGKDYLLGIKEGLGDKAGQIVSEVSYETTDATVDNQVSQIKDAGTDAYVVIATPAFATQAIQRKAALGWEPPINVITSVASSVAGVFEPAGVENGEGFVTSAYAKDPTDPAMASDPGIMEYTELLGKYEPDVKPQDAFAVYGMSVAQTLEYVMEDLDGPLCRESIMAKLKDFTWDEPKLLVDGINVQTGPGDAFPIQRVQLKQFDSAGKTWKPVGEIIDTASAG